MAALEAEPAVPPPFGLHPPRSRSGLDPSSREEFVQRLTAFRKAYLAQPRQARLGTLQLVELDQIRHRFGRRWPFLREKVLGMVEGALHRDLGGDDLYVVAGETLVYVLRTGIARADAERRGRLLAAEVTERLCGAIPGGVAVRLRHMLFDFDAGLAGIAGFEQLRNRIEAQGRTLDDAELRLFLDHAPAMRPLFRPMLQLRKGLVSAYQLAPVVSLPDGRLAPVSSLCPHSLNGVFDAESDNWGLQQLAPLLGGAAGCRRAPLIVPVHYETLAAMRFREPFMILCRQLPRVSSRRLLVEILDLPASLPQARVRELMAYLQPFCVTMIARLPADLIVADHLVTSGIRGLSLDGAELDPDRPETAERLAMLVETAAGLRMRSLLLGAPGVRLCHLALRAGVDHVSGDGFMPPVQQPGRVFSVHRRA